MTSSTICSPTPPDLEEHIFRPLTPETDQFAQSMFEAYLSSQAATYALSPEDVSNILPHPTSFHAVTHHISLYILALRGGHTALCTTVLDQLRRYYAENNFTASPFRLAYVYAHTDGPCSLREFVIESAASRILSEARHSTSETRLDGPSSQNALPSTTTIAAATPSAPLRRRHTFSQTGNPTDLTPPSLLTSTSL
ncbi:hypothetical protein AOQ84DRAFT_229016, partial [Glonium stellatum]